MCGRKTTVAEYSVVKESWKRTSVSKPLLPSRLDLEEGIDVQTLPAFAPSGALQAGLPTVARVTRLARLRQGYGGQPSRDHERRLVENTGLEPVTSWLQTRRSPS